MKPVRLPAAATRALPRWGLFALSLLYILPGLFGRDPWKNDDAAGFGVMWTMAHGYLGDWAWPHIAGLPVNDEGPLAFWIGGLCIKVFGFILGDPLAARISTLLAFLLGALSVWFGAFILACRSEAQPLKLAFGGQPEPKDFGRTLADAALLIYLACFGLLLHSHEASAEALQVSLVAFLIYRLAAYVELPNKTNAAIIGLTLGALTLTRGWVVPLALWLSLFGSFLHCFGLPRARTVIHLCAASLIALLMVLLWLGAAGMIAPDNTHALADWLSWNRNQLSLPQWSSVKYCLRTGIWFCWPALPFAAWSVYAWRRQWRALHIALPVSFALWLTALMLLSPQPDPSNLLPLLPPLAILAAFGLPTMKRGAINAIDWFAVMALTTCAAFLWLAWYAMLNGRPAQLHRNVLKLVPGFKPEFNLVAFLLAAGVTVAWFFLVHWRLARRPAVLWRAVVLSSGGVILCWGLAMTLFLAPINYGKSYALVASEIASKLPPGVDCVETNATPAQRASLAYFGHLPFVPPERSCNYLLLQDSVKAKDSTELAKKYRGNGWQLMWTGRRPSDRDERLRLYQRNTTTSAAEGNAEGRAEGKAERGAKPAAVAKP